MRLAALSLALLSLSLAGRSLGADAEGALAKGHGGKVWIAKGTVAPLPGNQIEPWLAARSPTEAIDRPTKDGVWTLSYLAIFKKPAFKGPMTIRFVDKKSPTALVDEYSTDNDTASTLFWGTYQPDPDRGFNKGHSYLIRVGQILRGKFTAYAAGEFSLL